MSGLPTALNVLTPDETAFLRCSLGQWGGPAHPTDQFAAAMGFTDADRIADEAWALWTKIEADDVLTADDWKKTLLATEVAFASDIVGAGVDFSIVTGFSDEESITILRRLQRKLIKLYVSR